MPNHAGLIIKVEKKSRSEWAPVIVEGFMEKVREKLSPEIKTAFG